MCNSTNDLAIIVDVAPESTKNLTGMLFLVNVPMKDIGEGTGIVEPSLPSLETSYISVSILKMTEGIFVTVALVTNSGMSSWLSDSIGVVLLKTDFDLNGGSLPELVGIDLAGMLLIWGSGLGGGSLPEPVGDGAGELLGCSPSKLPGCQSSESDSWTFRICVPGFECAGFVTTFLRAKIICSKLSWAFVQCDDAWHLLHFGIGAEHTEAR